MDADVEGRRRSALHDLMQLLGFLKPFKRQAIYTLALIGSINILGVVTVYAVAKAINVFSGYDRLGLTPAQAVLAFAGIYLVLGEARAVLILYREPVSMRLAMDLLRWLRTTLYGKVQTLSFNYLDRLTSGQIIERATGDVTQIRDFLTDTCFQAFDAVVMGIFAIGAMFWMSPKLALITLLPFPVIAFLYNKAVWRLRYLRQRVRDEVDVMTTRLTETIFGARVIRSFGRQEQEKASYQGILNEILRRVRQIFRIRATTLNATYGLARVWAAVLLGVGGYLVIKDSQLPPGESRFGVGYLYAFMMYLMWLLWRVQMLMEVGEGAQDARAALDRITALMEAPPDVQDAPDARDLPAGGGAVVFENVSFSYVEPPHPEADVVERMKIDNGRRGPHAIRHVNLSVRPGETVALVGPTGSGKSTIINLLPRFYDPHEGRVLIDGQDLRQTRLENLRRNVGIVFQETFLFRGSIAENIAYGRPEASREEIMHAARLAQADEFIEGFPAGYDTEVGDRGVTLSGGQRQRIAIARALLKRPRILVLDDAMAAVDAQTERLIRRQLEKLMKGRTTFVIAHRLATVRTADRVVVLREGTVDDVGTHEELLGRNDFYRTLCESQLTADAVESSEPLAGGGDA
jgi:ABC-type multidrug transport system fused ATPase/permease subunit